MIVNAENKPPLGGMGGSIHDWERGLDPWHKNAFPKELQSVITKNETTRQTGWCALDGAGNMISFVPDGTEMKDPTENYE